MIDWLIVDLATHLNVKMFLLATLCLTAAAATVRADSLPYTLEDNVVVVHDRNFDTVVNKHRTVLLEFYAPWCGHCKNLVPEYAAVGKFIHRGQEASGEFNMVVAKSDATANRNLAMAQSVSSYPTILLFQNGALVEKYSGERSFEDIMEYVKDMDASCAREDSTGAPSKTSQAAARSAETASTNPSGTQPKRSFRYAPDELVASGFVSIVDSQSVPELEASDKPWLIAVFKNGCGHCRRMEGEWTDALRALSASDAATGIRVGVLDAEQLDRESPIMSILPGFRGTPAFFSFV